MAELNPLLDIVSIGLNCLTTIIVSVVAGVVFVLRKGTETAVEDTVRNSLKKINWPEELGRDLQRIRGVERQELRFKSYGALWAKLSKLAVYDDAKLDKATANELSKELSGWYFSETGGLFLTPQSRYFYFALQDLLRATANSQEEWVAERSPLVVAEQSDKMREVLKRWRDEETIAGAIEVLDYITNRDFDDWENRAPDLGNQWRAGIASLAAHWNDLDKEERFATLQQVGSKLRSALINDLESRLR